MRKPSMSYRSDLFGDDTRLTVETVDNHVYFYADVDSDRGLALMRTIRETDAELRAQHLSRGLEDMPLTPIWLHINSFGGDLFTGFSIADQLIMIQSPIYTVVEGICASAATLISLSGSKRFILPNSFMLIHQLSGMVLGTHEQFKDEMQLQEMAMKRLTAFYVGKTGVEEEALQQMLTRDYWLDASESIERGFADEILQR